MLFDHLYDDVDGGHVRLLDAIAVGEAADLKLEVALTSEFTAALSEKGDRFKAASSCEGNCCDQVGGVAACGECDEDISLLAEGLDRTGEDIFVAEIVGDAADVAGAREGDCGKGWALMSEDTGELFGKVHRIAEASAVSCDENLLPLPKTVADHLGSALHKGEAAGLFQKFDGAHAIFNCL